MILDRTDRQADRQTRRRSQAWTFESATVNQVEVWVKKVKTTEKQSARLQVLWFKRHRWFSLRYSRFSTVAEMNENNPIPFPATLLNQLSGERRWWLSPGGRQPLSRRPSHPSTPPSITPIISTVSQSGQRLARGTLAWPRGLRWWRDPTLPGDGEKTAAAGGRALTVKRAGEEAGKSSCVVMNGSWMDTCWCTKII